MNIPFEMVGVVGFPVAIGLGLIYGLGPCLVSCLPYLGPVFLNSSGGIRGSWRILLPIALGRLTVYGSFGAISGWWSQRYVGGVEAWVVNLVVGMAALLVGISLLMRKTGCSPNAEKQCAQHKDKDVMQIIAFPHKSGLKSQTSEPTMPAGLYLMGVAMALVPCAPMSVVLVSAAASGSPWTGLALGLGFGLGAIVAPSLVYGFAVAYFGQRLREQLGKWLPRLEMLSAALFLLLGIKHVIKGCFFN